jgi:signal transduction histidine kinase
MKEPTSLQGTVLIVDDVPDNISALLELLRTQGFKILAALNGVQGISIAQSALPDLILLDVLMPGINGFETCRQLKLHSSTKDIPVIFMTALHELVDKVKGFQMGAADYIVKPFQYEEVLGRVTVHIKLRQLQQQLQQQNQQLQEQTQQLLEEINLRKVVEASLSSTNLALAMRTGELEQRNQELDSFAHTVAHDLRNPLSGIVNLIELIELDCETQFKVLKRLALAKQTGRKMFSIISALLTLAGVSRQAQVEIQRLNMSHLIQQVLTERFVLEIKASQAVLQLPKSWPAALGYGPWVEEVWANYISNGLKYGGQPPHLEFGADDPYLPPTHSVNVEGDSATIHYPLSTIHYPLTGKPGWVRFWVRDNGKGIAPDAQSQLFTPFTRLQSKVDGHGLGLSIVQQIVDRLGGQVGVESEVGKGSLFYFTLPAG